MDVAVVTDAARINEEDGVRYLLPALADRGLDARHVAWDDPAMDWSRPRLCVIRATWDYHLRLAEYLTWAEAVAARTMLWNPLEVLRWNTRKTYLRDLERHGIATIPTVWLQRGDTANLAALMGERGWRSVVVKPQVSASAYATRLVTREELPKGQAHMAELLAARDVMVQPFLPTVATSGERSLVFIDGEHTHTLRRRPAIGPVNETHVEGELLANNPEEAAFARLTLHAAGYPYLYARVDVIHDEDGALRLMELELVEPSLSLRSAPWTAQRLADAIVRRLKA